MKLYIFKENIFKFNTISLRMFPSKNILCHPILILFFSKFIISSKIH